MLNGMPGLKKYIEFVDYKNKIIFLNCFYNSISGFEQGYVQSYLKEIKKREGFDISLSF